MMRDQRQRRGVHRTSSGRGVRRSIRAWPAGAAMAPPGVGRAWRWIAMAFAVLAPWLAFARSAHADDGVAEFRLGDRDTPHVGVPFFLDLVIDGFDEAPPPDPPKL